MSNGGLVALGVGIGVVLTAAAGVLTFYNQVREAFPDINIPRGTHLTTSVSNGDQSGTSTTVKNANATPSGSFSFGSVPNSIISEMGSLSVYARQLTSKDVSYYFVQPNNIWFKTMDIGTHKLVLGIDVSAFTAAGNAQLGIKVFQIPDQYDFSMDPGAPVCIAQNHGISGEGKAHIDPASCVIPFNSSRPKILVQTTGAEYNMPTIDISQISVQ